jgi:AhpC/TSA family protein
VAKFLRAFLFASLFTAVWASPLGAAELKVGDKAPDFTLKNTKWKDVKLSDYLGKKSVVLAFYVLAFTPG